MELDFDNCYNNECSVVGLFARIGDINGLTSLLARNHDVSIHDDRGWFPIHEAAFGNHVDCLKLLLSTLASAGLLDDDDDDCARNCKKRRLSHHRDEHTVSMEPNAESVKNTRMLPSLINAQAYDGSTALLIACKKGNADAAEVLLDHGADPNIGTLDEMSPLIAAINPGRSEECVKMLLKHKASVHATYFNGWTALHEAASLGDCDTLLRLVNESARVYARDDDGITPVFIASQYGHHQCLQLLLSASTDPVELLNVPTNDGVTCLYIAAQEGYDKIIQVLLQYGCDANQCTNDGIHPLVPAVKRNYFRCAELILDVASPAAIRRSSIDPVFVAVEENSMECLQLLLERGLPINRCSDYFVDFAVPIYMFLQPLLAKSRITPLGLAINRRNAEMVRLLLEHDAQPVVRAERTFNPLVLAVLKRQTPEILELLLQFNAAVNVSSSVSGIPDAMLISLHPLYRSQLTKLLKAGLCPRLEKWCSCSFNQADQANDNEPSFVPLWNELPNVLTRKERAELLRLLVPYCSGLPLCCASARSAAAENAQQSQILCITNVPCLQQLARLEVRKNISTAVLFGDDSWCDDLGLPVSLKNFINYNA